MKKNQAIKEYIDKAFERNGNPSSMMISLPNLTPSIAKYLRKDYSIIKTFYGMYQIYKKKEEK